MQVSKKHIIPLHLSPTRLDTYRSYTPLPCSPVTSTLRAECPRSFQFHYTPPSITSHPQVFLLHSLNFLNAAQLHQFIHFPNVHEPGHFDDSR